MECNDYSISKLFTESFVVPDYQRPYAWMGRQLDDFFNDLIKFMNTDGLSKEDFYLFGQIIIHREGEIYNIVDGQQRMATSIIFLCALRDYIKDHYPSEESLLNKINNAIGFDDEEGFRLKMGKINQEFFHDYVQCADHEKKPKTCYDNLVKDAYLNLHSKIRSYGIEGNIDGLRRVANTFLNYFHVSCVETSKLSQAFVIFETLNSRGMPLDTQDLLKNRFFCYLGEKYSYIKDEWSNTVVTVIEAGGDPAQLIRYYWNSSHEFVRDKDLFKAVSQVTNPTDLKKVFDGIIEASSTYKSLIHPVNVPWLTENALESLNNLEIMNAKSFFPIIISMRMRDYSNIDIERILAGIESLVFRNQAVMKKTANANEVFFAKLAREYASKGESVTSMLEEISKHIPSDKELEMQFSIYKPKIQIGRMILTSLYNSDHPELRIKGTRAVHIEHIMPLTKGEWDVDDDVWTEYKDRLGNMVLLDGKKNIAASNDLFCKKKPRYLKSDIDDTQKIADNDVWTKAEIECRQKQLFGRVCKRWPKLFV